MAVSEIAQVRQYPEPRAMLRLIKPITWFPPIWAFLCGAVSSGIPLGKRFCWA
jgi:chlorophyll/bacteriochlorophyll a synthase